MAHAASPSEPGTLVHDDEHLGTDKSVPDKPVDPMTRPSPPRKRRRVSSQGARRSSGAPVPPTMYKHLWALAARADTSDDQKWGEVASTEVAAAQSHRRQTLEQQPVSPSLPWPELKQRGPEMHVFCSQKKCATRLVSSLVCPSCGQQHKGDPDNLLSFTCPDVY
jgi:hypothetical protein